MGTKVSRVSGLGAQVVVQARVGLVGRALREVFQSGKGQVECTRKVQNVASILVLTFRYISAAPVVRQKRNRQKKDRQTERR